MISEAISTQELVRNLVRDEIGRVAMESQRADAEYQVILGVVLLAFLVERALAVLFETRVLYSFLERHPSPKAPVAFVVSLIACAYWEVDAPAALFSQPESWLGFVFTAAAVAGGSKASLKFFRDYLDIRSQFSRERDIERRRRFEYAQKNVEEIIEIQEYLSSYGYLETAGGTTAASLTPIVTSGSLDAPTEKALRRFQELSDLPPIGWPTEETRRILQSPRCGAQDFARAASSRSGWSTKNLTWQLGPTLPEDLEPSGAGALQTRCRAAINAAFGTWQTGLASDGWTFTEAAAGARADIVLEWVERPDPDRQLMRTSVAHAMFPWEPAPITVHFDRQRKWSNQGAPGCFDVEGVALHEIGHCLGREGHSSNRRAIMYRQVFEGSAGADRRQLTAGDVAAIRNTNS